MITRLGYRYTTIGDVSERVYECPDECPPPVPPKQMEVLYTKPTKVITLKREYYFYC